MKKIQILIGIILAILSEITILALYYNFVLNYNPGVILRALGTPIPAVIIFGLFGSWIYKILFEVKMEETKDYKNMGMVSLILAIIGIASFFVLGALFGLPLGIIALILGYISKKHGDKNGAYGFYISLVVVILGIIVMIAATIYVYVNSMLGP